MFTPHNVLMSERAERIYKWLNSRNIPFTPFSTDDHVFQYYKQLQDALQDIRDKKNVPSQDARILKQMETDLSAIMNRLPANRSHLQNAKTFSSSPVSPSFNGPTPCDCCVGQVHNWAAGDPRYQCASCGKLTTEQPKCASCMPKQETNNTFSGLEID